MLDTIKNIESTSRTPTTMASASAEIARKTADFFERGGNITEVEGFKGVVSSFNSVSQSSSLQTSKTSIPVIRVTKAGVHGVRYESIVRAAQANNCKVEQISKVLNGKIQTAAGYKWVKAKKNAVK